jgi:DNA-binding beta-propeller fold protein YncE
MAMKTISIASVAAAMLVAGCGGGGGGSSGAKVEIESFMTVPNVGAGTNFSFDLGVVDSAKSRYYFTDRNNKSVDVFDTRSGALIKQITGGFAGCDTGPTCVGANNDKSGPDGINLINGTTFIYVGDVNSVKIIDTQSDTVVKTVSIGGNSGLRADEGCYDPDHKLFMISSPGENPPFATFIDTTTQTIVATLRFTDPGSGPAGPASAGLEACVYDHASGSFLVNNDGSTANPHGEVDVIPAAAILVGTPANPAMLTIPTIAPGTGWKVYPLGNCDPTGLDLGPASDVAISCRQGTAGVPLTVQILDRTTGANLATINSGGGDQIAYDATTNRYYLAASRLTATRLSSGPACTTASPCTPSLVVIDAAARTELNTVPSGNNAHSVAVDPVTMHVFMPFSSATAPAGCFNCSGFPNGGLAVYRIL